MKIEAAKSTKTFTRNVVQHPQQNRNKIETYVDQTPPLWFSKRFFVTAVIFFCYINVTILMTNINIAIVEMTSTKLITAGNLTIVHPAEFQWDPSLVGIVSSTISYGGLFALAGGFFVHKLGGAVSCAFVLMMCGILSILHPASLYLDFRLFILFRLLVGLFGNFFYVSATEIYSRWFPRRERTKLITFCYAGSNIGMTIMYPLFGYIADRQGWQMVFYVSGIISLISALLCLIVVKNLPSQDKWISEKELTYILSETHDAPQKRISHPYKKILLSPPVWALCLVDFTLLWSANLTTACLPLYAKDITGRSTDEIGYISSIPLVLTTILSPIVGILINHWKNHSDIESTRMDKIIISVTFLSISVIYAACAIFSNFIATVVLFVAIQCIITFVPPVLEPNVVEIAPNDSSVVAALTKISSSMSTIVCRTLIGFMTINHTIQEWNNSYFVTSGIMVIGAAIFVEYGSSEAQSWSLVSVKNDEAEERDYLIKPNIENNVKTNQNVDFFSSKLEHNQNPDEHEEKKEPYVDQIPSIWSSKRFYTTLVVFLCFMNVGMIISNINIAVVEMTSPKNITSGNATITKPAEFQWDPSTIGIVSSIISYGGLFSIGGGYFVNKLGGSVSGAVVLMICGILTLLQPATLYMDYRIFLAFRLLTGFFANCFFISSAEIFSRWFPRRERSTLISFCSNGGNVGMTVMYPVFGLIADRLGWKMVFYTSGLISLAIGWLCLTVVKNLPSQDKRISEKELAYILNETYDDSRKRYHTSHPYKKILLSPAVRAICLGDFTMLWVQNVVSGCLPLYAKDSTGKSTDEIGLLSSIPVATTIILYPLSGAIIDYWKNHHVYIKPTRMDKTIIGSTFLAMSVFFLGCVIFSNFTISMMFIVMIQITKSIVQPVLEPNVVNIAPNDSSIVAGLTKFCSCSSTIISRTLTGFMTINHTTQEWNNCFLLASVVLIIGAVTFVKYGSSEPQSWSLSSDTKEKQHQVEEDETRYLLNPNY